MILILVFFIISLCTISRSFHINRIHRHQKQLYSDSFILHSTSTPTSTTTVNNDNSNASTRQYVPRSTTGVETVTAGGQVSRVYKPRSVQGANTGSSSNGSSSSSGGGSWSSPRSTSTYNSYNRNSGGGPGSSSSSKEPSIFLQYPQLLIRYRIPREKSPFKEQLEELQATFKEQSDSSRGSWGDNDRGGGGYRAGGGSTGGGKDSFFESFQPPVGGGADKKRGKVGGVAGKANERKGSEGERPKASTKIREKVGVDDIDDDGNEYDDDEGTGATDGDSQEDDDDYYGDEGPALSLDDVPVDSLRNMETEGYTLEEMQMSLYGEYGIKASMGAIKKKLFDAMNERKGRKRTGKTRRDKQKARNARYADSKYQGIKLPENVAVIQIAELASLMDVGGGEIVKHLMMNVGMMATMTQNIDIKVARDIVLFFGKKLYTPNDGNDDDSDDDDIDDDSTDDSANEEITVEGVVLERIPRSPVVTIMGHVDHGKTTLLDSIRATRVAAGEAGGITQGITAFKVLTQQGRNITFIDTPGHAAFGEMRKRGANITDIVVLVVAADDGIMEQTKECIAAAKAAHCPIVVAVNKIDKVGADAERILQDLMKYDVLVETFGGEVQAAMVSAKAGTGIDGLLDKILLQTDIMSLKAPVSCPAEGTCIEARIDKGLGVVVSALVQKGTIRTGDYVLAGSSWGRVRRIIVDNGKDVKEAGPSTPIQIVGMNSVPAAGDSFIVTSNEAGARDVADARARLARQSIGNSAANALKVQASGILLGTIENKEVMKVPLLIKADVAGSVEALISSINSLSMSDDESICSADIVFSGVGPVTSSDVSIAAVSKAKIVAFNVVSNYNAMEDARANNVDIGYYSVVYDLLDEVEATIKTTLAPPPPGQLVGKAEIKKVFKIGKVGKVAGCLVTEGILKLTSDIRVMRGKRNPVYTGKLSQLKVVKDIVQEVPTGSECGLSFDDFQDFEEGDIVECFIGGSSSNSNE